jgi:hypothetical protein
MIVATALLVLDAVADSETVMLNTLFAVSNVAVAVAVSACTAYKLAITDCIAVALAVSAAVPPKVVRRVCVALAVADSETSTPYVAPPREAKGDCANVTSPNTAQPIKQRQARTDM